MLSEKAKIDRLIGELLHYALQAEARKVVITVEEVEGQIAITVEDDGPSRSERERQQAERSLNVPQRNELSEYYGGLVGEETCGPCDLRMAGMMVDGGRVEAGDAGTRVRVWWRHK